MLSCPDGEEKADYGNSGSNPKKPDARPPELAVEPRQGTRGIERRMITIRKVRARTIGQAAGSRRWVVLVSAALIRQYKIKAIHTTGKKDSKSHIIQDLLTLGFL